MKNTAAQLLSFCRFALLDIKGAHVHAHAHAHVAIPQLHGELFGDHMGKFRLCCLFVRSINCPRSMFMPHMQPAPLVLLAIVQPQFSQHVHWGPCTSETPWLPMLRLPYVRAL